MCAFAVRRYRLTLCLWRAGCFGCCGGRVNGGGLRCGSVSFSRVVCGGVEAPKDCSSGSCGRFHWDEPGCFFLSFSEAKNSPVMSPLHMEGVCECVCVCLSSCLCLCSCLLVSVTVHPCVAVFKGISHQFIPKLEMKDKTWWLHHQHQYGGFTGRWAHFLIHSYIQVL